MTDSLHYRVELNGEPARVEDLRHLVQTNYGHFSAMQVRDGGVRGLDLHLDRIESATHELFGAPIERNRVRGCLRHAISGRGEALSLRVNIFARALDREHLIEAVEPDVLVTVAPAPQARALPPLRAKSFRYTRTLAHVKHVGTFPLFHHRRLAQLSGFDDAVFVDASDHLEEGTIWNIGFFDGNGIIWPDAPHLTGVSMQLLQQGFARSAMSSAMRSIALADLPRFRSAFFTNSALPVRVISRIDDVEFAVDPALEAMLLECHDSNVLQPV
jgi:branched-subunit amino acid aminotransferase/4-amino-4-deoxychorismate lyase